MLLNITVNRKLKKTVARVIGIKDDGSEDSVQYTSDDLDAERKRKGLAPASISKRHDYHAIRVALKREVTRLFIDTYWPLYSMFCNVRVHDLKHTFGRRLRLAKVPYPMFDTFRLISTNIRQIR